MRALPLQHCSLLLLLACGPKPVIPNITTAPPESLASSAAAEFTLGPGDRIAISVWRHQDLDMEITIAPDGTITYPLVGQILVSGLTYSELSDTITEAVATHYVDPQVSVNILELKNQKVVVLGEVSQPSILQLSNEMSILEALTIAGGINTSARTENVLLVRGGMDDPQLYTVDVKSIYIEGAFDQMVYLQRGDIILVPTRTITDVSRYFREVSSILAPFVGGSAIYRNTVSGGAQGTSSVLE